MSARVVAVRIVVVAEADADRRLACGLVDRKILHHAPAGFGTSELRKARVWCGLEAGTEFTVWSALEALAKERYVRALRSAGPLGFGSRDARRFDWLAAHKALMLAALMEPRPDAVLFVRDADQQERERRASLEQARRDAALSGLEVFLAMPRCKREAWVLNGFVARHDNERRVLTRLQKELKFDPCQHAERLVTARRGAARDAKRVLRLLIKKGDEAREAACWESTEWNTLRARGVGTGLAQFLDEVKTRLVPMVTGQPS